MLRFFAGAGSALLMVVAGFFIWKIQAESETVIPPAPEAAPVTPLRPSEAPPTPPAAPEKSKEEKRFDRADANRDAALARAEYATTAPKARPKAKCNC